MMSNSVTQLRSYTNSAIADIAENSSPISPLTLRNRRAERRRLRIERQYRCIKWRVFKCFVMFHNVLLVVHDVLLVVHDVSQCFTCVSWCFTCVSWCFWFTCVSWCFTMFNNILWCLASRATIGDRTNATGIGDNSAEIGDNSAEIGDDAAGIINIAAKVITCWTPSWIDTGVTLFLEEKFQTCGTGWLLQVYCKFAIYLIPQCGQCPPYFYTPSTSLLQLSLSHLFTAPPTSYLVFKCERLRYSQLSHVLPKMLHPSLGSNLIYLSKYTFQ